MSSLRESNPRLYFFQENIIYKIIFLITLYSSKRFTERRPNNKYLNLATAKERSCLDQPFLKVELSYDVVVVHGSVPFPELIPSHTSPQLFAQLNFAHKPVEPI